jgi:acyl-CoA dehydrogenase family protein 9
MIKATAETGLVKSLFFGDIQEDRLFPYPALEPDKKARLAEILGSLRAVAQREIDPRQSDHDGRLSEGVVSGIKTLGLMGMQTPREYGGLDLDMTSYARVMQEVATYDPSVAVFLGAHQSIGMKALLLFGTSQQKSTYLPRLASGEQIAAFALTEATAGSDVQGMSTKAVVNEDGSYTLDGEKIWITNGGLADVITVFAKLKCLKDGLEKERVTAFIVEKSMGFRAGPPDQKMGQRGANTTTIHLDNVRVPAANLLGEPGNGFKIAMEVLNNGRLGLAAGCVGTAQYALQLAVDHARQRQQFGKKIAEFGMIQQKVAEMVLGIYAMESIVYLTTGMVDRGAKDFAIESSICKAYNTETLWTIVNHALQIASGAGYMREHPYERLVRDSRINMIFEGTNEIQRMFIALSGLEGPGQKLTELAKAFRHPIGDMGVIYDYVASKVSHTVNAGHLTKADPLLKEEARGFEDGVQALAVTVEAALRKHGRHIIDEQFLHKRVAEIAMQLYVQIACIARATTRIEVVGAVEAQAELRLCKAVCRHARHTVAQLLEACKVNDDDEIRKIAGLAYERGGYFLPTEGGLATQA